jgi:plasmid stabilization system protein ParE
VAQREAREAARWYEGNRDGLGDEFLEELARVFEHIEKFPHAATQIPVSDANREVRRTVLDRFPYVVIHEVRAEGVMVIAVAHGRRKPRYWIDRLN